MPSPQRKATSVAKTASPKRFVFLLLERFTMLSFAGAIEPLRIANRVAGEEIYRWVLAGEGEFVTCSNGAAFKLDIGLEDIERDDVVLVCGGLDVQKAATKGVLNWLRREAR
ncbi:MAG: hypothetical protein RL472_1986, partial [Pseudomonadota bacterium]